jgi:colicin import membrane protein
MFYAPKAGYQGKRKKKPVKVSVPYAPTPKGKEAEEADRGHVTVPYAPTPTGKAAEKKASRKAARKVERKAAPAIRAKLRAVHVPIDPDTAYQQAKYHGTLPDVSLRKHYGEAAYKRALNAATKHADEREGLKEDPAAEFVISTAATAGLGGLAGAAGKAIGSEGGSFLAKGGATLASKEASAGETALAGAAKKLVAKVKGAPKAGAERVKTAPKRAAARVKETPERVRTAPARAKKAATTAEGRKAAARSAARHPVRTGVPAAAVLPPGVLPGGASDRVRAAAEGTASAIVHHPAETAKTTLRSLPAAITGPAALLGAAGESVLHGTPKPLEKTASEQFEGVKQIAENTFSGDPKKAERAARKEGSLAFITPLPAISRTSPYKALKATIREDAAALRRKVAAKGETANRSVRHAPKGTKESLFAATGRRDVRKNTALIKQRADNPHRVAAAHHESLVTKAIAKAPKGSHVALQPLVEYGIRDSKGVALVREKGPKDAQLIKALDYVDAHPEVFQDKAFKKALEVVGEASRTAPAALVGKGERARLMQQGDVLGHPRPEHMAPETAVRLTGERTREGAWAKLAQADKQLSELRLQGRAKFDQAKIVKGREAAQLKAEGKTLYAQARALRSQNKKLYDALDPYTRPGQSIDGSKRQPYDSRMLAEYKQKVEEGRKAEGLAPAIWTNHSPANGDKGAGMENRFPTSAGRVEHMREGGYAKADNLDRSLEGLLRGTVHMPRLRAAGKQFGRDFVQEFKTPFKLDGKEKVVGQGSTDWTAITSPRSEKNPNGGQFDPKTWARFPLREWKNAVKDPFTEDSRLTELLTEAEAGRIKGSEPWVLMPREAIREARAQISPEHNIITETANKASRVSSRLLLGTNPAWAIAQIPAEGIPLLMAKPSLLNPGKVASLERDIQRYKKTNPEEALALQATAGASPLNAAVNRTPLDMQETYTPALWDKGAKALTRGRTARSAISFAKLRALGVFDVKRQNEYRTLLAAAEADKRFRSWHASLTGLFDKQARLSRDFRGKSRAELWDWLTKDPKGKKELQKITDYVDNIQGNWSAFTRYERSLAPLAIFYPFLRYSLRWTLWTFPKTHPITATLAYTLGQANANQLEKLTGGPLQNPAAYAFPVTTNERGEKAVFPGGSRISPGQSSLTQALATGNPAQILSSANPFIGAGLTAVTGVEPFTGEKADKQGYAAINQLLTLPAPLRLASVKVGDEQSVASKAFEQFDPNKTARSLALPFIPQSGARFAGAEKLSKAFDDKYSNPVPSLPAEIWEAAYNKDWKLARELKAKRVEAEKGGDVVKAAEEPFFTDSGGELGKEGSEILKYITGVIQLPVEEKKPKVKLKGGIGGTGGSIGGHPVGSPIGGSVGGSIGGGIGGHPIGGA